MIPRKRITLFPACEFMPFLSRSDRFAQRPPGFVYTDCYPRKQAQTKRNIRTEFIEFFPRLYHTPVPHSLIDRVSYRQNPRVRTEQLKVKPSLLHGSSPFYFRLT